MYCKTIIIGCLVVGLLGGLVFAMGEKPTATSAPPKAIDFKLEDLDGKTHKLSDYKGRIVFLNFWASWCSPCRAEMPSMQKLYTTWDSREFAMLAVDIGESRERVKAFAEGYGYTFPILLDQDKNVARKYMVRGIPTTYLIGKDGEIIEKIVGSREWTLEEVQRLVK